MLTARSATSSVKSALQSAGLTARVTSSVTHSHRQTVIDCCTALADIAAVLERTFPDAAVHCNDDLRYLTVNWPADSERRSR